MADDKILSDISNPEEEEARGPFHHALGRMTSIKSHTFDWKAEGLSGIGQEGKYSPEVPFRQQVWELSICKSGIIFALKINCNRGRRGASVSHAPWNVFARIQVTIKSIAGSGVTGFSVEGARFFSSPDDCMTWSFDRSINALIAEDSLCVTTRITVYYFANDQNGYVNGNCTTVKCDASSSQDAGDSKVGIGAGAGHVSPFPTDMTFVVSSGDKVHVHRGVLMAASPYFRETMNKDSSVSEIRLPDMKYSECLSLVRYMYTNEVECDDKDLFLTFKAAERFKMTDFVNKCRPVITQDNVLKFLDPKKNNFIIEECWKLIDDQFTAVASTAEFNKLPVPVLQAIIKRDSLKASEDSIYNAVYDWSKAQCTEKGLPVTVPNQKEILKDILPLIRFPIMTGAEFTNGPVKHGLLDPTDIINCFMYQTSKTKADTLTFNTQERG